MTNKQTVSLTNSNKDRLLVEYIKRSPKVDIVYLLNLWREGFISINSKEPTIREMATQFDLANDNNRSVFFNLITRKVEISASQRLVTNQNSYSTRVESETSVNWRKWGGYNKHRAKLFGADLPVGLDPLPIKPLYGLELEVNYNTDNNSDQRVSNIYELIHQSTRGIVPGIGNRDVCMIKRDGSIGDYGLEIVTIPLQFNDMQSVIKGLLTNHYLQSDGLEESDRCGVHFHVSREFLVPTPYYVLGLTYIWNSPRWYNAFVHDLTGRRYDHSFARWCGYNYLQGAAPHTFKEFIQMYVSGRYTKGSNNSDNTRYGSLTFSESHKTMEFRSFSCTLDPERLLSYLEFIDSTISYLTLGNGGLTIADSQAVVNPDHYLRWLMDGKNTGKLSGLSPRVEYQHLIRTIVLDIIPHRFSIQDNGMIDFHDYETVPTTSTQQQ